MKVLHRRRPVLEVLQLHWTALLLRRPGIRTRHQGHDRERVGFPAWGGRPAHVGDCHHWFPEPHNQRVWVSHLTAYYPWLCLTCPYETGPLGALCPVWLLHKRFRTFHNFCTPIIRPYQYCHCLFKLHWMLSRSETNLSDFFLTLVFIHSSYILCLSSQLSDSFKIKGALFQQHWEGPVSSELLPLFKFNAQQSKHDHRCIK